MRIFVTVGMGPWPFDRLLNAVVPLCAIHQVFAQTGTAHIAMPCESAPFVTFPETLSRIEEADVVITHAGNTIRLVQRAGKVPIAMAREEARGEMANDHQVHYLKEEQKSGRVIALWDPLALPELVQAHAHLQAQLLATRPLPDAASGKRLAETLDGLCFKWIP